MIFSLASAVHFSWSGDRGVGFPADLYNRWWRCWYACQRVGRDGTLILFWRFLCLIFTERGAGGRVFSGSLSSAAVLLVCTPADREGERAEHFFNEFSPLNIPGAGGGGGVWSRSLPSSAARLVCMPMGREGKRAEYIIFSFRRLIFLEQGVRGRVFD